MSRIFLLRHAHSVANEKGILAGRLPEVALSEFGLEQRKALLKRLNRAKFDQVISSPIQRCVETLYDFEKNPDIFEDFQEVDYGSWSGQKMTTLMRNKKWREAKKDMASIRFPNGESLPEVQIRALNGLEVLQKSKAKNILISTHADVVKVLLMHILEVHLNNIDKLQIDNASISIIENSSRGLKVIRVNDNTSRISELLA